MRTARFRFFAETQLLPRRRNQSLFYSRRVVLEILFRRITRWTPRTVLPWHVSPSKPQHPSLILVPLSSKRPRRAIWHLYRWLQTFPIPPVSSTGLSIERLYTCSILVARTTKSSPRAWALKSLNLTSLNTLLFRAVSPAHGARLSAVSIKCPPVSTKSYRPRQTLSKYERLGSERTTRLYPANTPRYPQRTKVYLLWLVLKTRRNYPSARLRLRPLARRTLEYPKFSTAETAETNP
mmetsp:Transcript_1438/g.4558  ORF Transcript_1438/g.4558 Transcript_1438/m.4558 type:complete len:237 (-) Transcript_1438:605-1315(-)